jgi:hypothetical protein
MKLSNAVALAAQRMDLAESRVRTIARTLAERRAAAAETDPQPAPGADDAGCDPIEPRGQERSLDLSLRASQSLLTRTINLLK